MSSRVAAPKSISPAGNGAALVSGITNKRMPANTSPISTIKFRDGQYRQRSNRTHIADDIDERETEAD